MLITILFFNKGLVPCSKKKNTLMQGFINFLRHARLDNANKTSASSLQEKAFFWRSILVKVVFFLLLISKTPKPFFENHLSQALTLTNFRETKRGNGSSPHINLPRLAKKAQPEGLISYKNIITESNLHAQPLQHYLNSCASITVGKPIKALLPKKALQTVQSFWSTFYGKTLIFLSCKMENGSESVLCRMKTSIDLFCMSHCLFYNKAGLKIFI